MPPCKRLCLKDLEKLAGIMSSGERNLANAAMELGAGPSGPRKTILKYRVIEIDPISIPIKPREAGRNPIEGAGPFGFRSAPKGFEHIEQIIASKHFRFLLSLLI